MMLFRKRPAHTHTHKVWCVVVTDRLCETGHSGGALPGHSIFSGRDALRWLTRLLTMDNDPCTYLGNCRCQKCLEEHPEYLDEDPEQFERVQAYRKSVQEEMRRMQLRIDKLENAKKASKESEERKKLQEEMLKQEEQERKLQAEEEGILELRKTKMEKIRKASYALKDRLEAEKKAKEAAIRMAEEMRLLAIREEEDKKREAALLSRAKDDAERKTVLEDMYRVKEEILKREREEEERKSREIEERKQALELARKTKEQERKMKEEEIKKRAEALMAQEAMIKAMEAEQQRARDEHAKREAEAKAQAEARELAEKAESERRASQAKARRTSQAATFVLPRHMGIFEFNKSGRKFRGVRKLKRIENNPEGGFDYADVAIVKCSDIMFLCSPTDNGPFVLLHVPFPRGEIQGAPETAPEYPPFTLRMSFGNQVYHLLTSGNPELEFWIKTISSPPEIVEVIPEEPAPSA